MWGAEKAYGAPKGMCGRQKGIWGAMRHMGHCKACGVLWDAKKAYLVLKTLCHWLGMKSKAGADDLLSLAGMQSKAGSDEASKQGW